MKEVNTKTTKESPNPLVVITVDKILFIKNMETLSTMNFTKLTFLLEIRHYNSLIFRNFIILITALLLSPTGAFAQEGNVSINLPNGTVKTFMKQVEQQTKYTFVYRNHVLDVQSKVTVNCKNKPIKEVLSQVFTPLNIIYSVNNNTIVLVKQDTRQANEERKTIKGIVYDETRTPVIGANITQGTTGVITDINGSFTMVANPSQPLTVSYIGYKPQEIKVNARNDLKIYLQESSVALNEVVVVGYGAQSEKLVTTSISSLKMNNVDQGNDYNVAKMMQGRTPGVNVASASGTPGEQPSVRVRGIASITGNSSPLYVVDGVPSESMPMLNPNDVERMDVLKDASAAAIYGSRANNGVVIITTKSGNTSSKTQVNASIRHSLGWISHDIPMANVNEYARTMQAAIDNWNVQQKDTKQFFIPDQITETDWMKEIQRNMAQTTTASINLSGGNDKTSFFTSLGFNDQEGIIRTSGFQQTNLRAKFTHKLNNWFKINLNLTGSYSKFDLIEDSDLSLKVIRTAREEQPWVGAYREDGTYTTMSTELCRHNPAMILNEEKWTIHKKQGVAALSFDITPVKGLKYTPSFSIYGILDEEKKTITEQNDYAERAGWGAIREQKNVSYRYIIDNVLSYENSWNKLMYSAMLGHSYEEYRYETFGAYSDNYSNGAFPSSNFGLINSGSNIYAGSIGYNAYGLESYFGRIALNWDNRYVLNATVRRDGSSRFSKDQRYGTFPSASFAWRIINEPFFPKGTPLNDLKLRVSWGNTGSMDGISNWAAMSLVTSGGSSYNGAAGFKIGADAANLIWEKANQINVGINAELFDGRITFSLDGYYQKTTGLLYNTSTLATTGYTSRTANVGSLENKGVEVMLSGQILNGPFKWDMNTNLSYTKNKLLSLDGVLDMKINSGGANTGKVMHALIVGQPVSAFYMLRQEGIYQTDSEVPIKLYDKGVRAGDCKFFDYDGDGDISDADRMYVGKVTPDVYGGITSNMSWKNFDLSIFCQYAIGGKILSAWKGCGGTEGTEHLGLASGNIKGYKNGAWIDSQQFYNISQYAANHYWRGEGTSNTVPRPTLAGTFSGGFGNNLVSTRYLEDASYFKIKTITLGYNIPKNLLSKIHVTGARIFVSLDNFFTFTKYSGYDPEFSYESSPTGDSYGADFGEQATLKSFIIGANINF